MPDPQDKSPQEIVLALTQNMGMRLTDGTFLISSQTQGSLGKLGRNSALAGRTPAYCPPLNPAHCPIGQHPEFMGTSRPLPIQNFSGNHET